MSRQPRSLSDKVVFITGAARGIGRATAVALVAEGARVVIADLDGELAATTARELGAGVGFVQLDVTDHPAFTASLDDVEQSTGPLDVLINNAGVMAIGKAEDDSHERAYRQFAINVFAVMHGTREAIHRMKPRGSGHIVNVASMAGVVPIPGAATYAASKHAVVGFCESLYWELRGTGIDLSYVLPSLVNTELAAGVKRTRAANVIEPEQVANEIVAALKVPRLAVFAPRSMGRITKVTGLIPRRLGDKIMTASGSDHVVLDSLGTDGRDAYEKRVAASAPAADAERAGR
ncbi:MAG: SDR family oxidoreductase [Jatrophihabitans sp.]|uniref:SDR family oxidoreductase n=1 Tax=Jatrophihabitans sp. TaxID=1932789 RepID=UPI0039106AF3